MNVNDSLLNLTTAMGTSRDGLADTVYLLTQLDKMQLEAAYRSNWLARKIVDIPAFDETREWRDWQAEKPQIEKLEAEEARLGVQAKVNEARSLARLYGGAAIIIGADQVEPTKALNINSVGIGGLKHLNVVSRHELIAEEIERDILSPYFGEPRSYQVLGNTGLVGIHPSRVVRFVGAKTPDKTLMNDGWGDSILQAIDRAVKHAGTAEQSVAGLLKEAKVDVIKVPGFMESLGTEEYRSRILDRYSLANVGKSINNALMIDSEEDWSQKTVSFSHLSEIITTFLQIASGAADIPATRLLGQSPGGLQSTGATELRNYYDRISAGQNLELRPALARLDEILIRSALGSRPPEVHYTWAPLWQMTEVEKADVALKKAQAVKAIADTGLIPDPAFARGVQNMFVEDGTFPGLDAALEEFGDDPEDKDAEAARLNAEQQRQQANDASPRTLYVRRDVLNADDIIAHFKGQGFSTTLTADDMHVTIAYSRQPVDWMKIGQPWSSEIEVAAGGPRMMEGFGQNGEAKVLLFASSELSWRHEEMKRVGATWDHPEYQPHISISYAADAPDLATVKPWAGKIVLGPEIFEEVSANWTSKVRES